MHWSAALALGFVALGVCGFTGSSWWAQVRGDPLHAPETRADRRELFAFSRSIRSDEYAVDLPLARSQQTTSPTYPLVNLDVGLGQIQRNPFDVPVLDWGIAFRPYVWPLLAGDTWSHGVRWFWRSCVVLLGLLAWFHVLAGRARLPAADPVADRRRANVAALGAIALFFSGHVTWWLGHAMPEIIGLAGVLIWAADRAARAADGRSRAMWLAAVCYLSACTFFQFYAPIWAPVLWLVSGSVLDVEYRATGSLRRAVARGVTVLVAVAIGVLISIAYYAPYIAVVKDTLYPGSRVEHGGNVPWSRLAEMAWPSLHSVAPYRGDANYYGVTPSNVCEASAVEVMPLFILLALALVSPRVRAALLATVRGRPALTATVAVLAAWVFLPVPTSVGTLALLRWSQSGRTWFAFGVGVALLTAAALAQLARRGEEPTSRKTVAIDCALALLALAVLAAWARQSLPDGRRGFWFPIILSPCLLIAAAPLVRRRAGALAMSVAWVLPLVVANGRVNPLLRSSDLFLAGEGHRVVASALRESPGRLLAFQTHTAGALAGYGWPVLATVDTAPEPSLWGFLEPDAPGLRPEIWNRYAHVHFSMTEETRLLSADAFVVRVDPCSPRFAALGVNHLLTRSGEALPPSCAGEYERRTAGSVTLWSRRAPVGLVGAAKGPRPGSALDFDWGRGAAAGTSIERRRDEAILTTPGGAGRHYALAMNLAAIDEVRCEGAVASFADTHVIASPTGPAPARCTIQYLGSLGAIKRLAGMTRSPQPPQRVLATTHRTP